MWIFFSSVTPPPLCFPRHGSSPFCARACRWMCVDVKKKKLKNRCRGAIYEMFGKSRKPHSSKQHVKQSGRDDPFLSAELPNDSQRSPPKPRRRKNKKKNSCEPRNLFMDLIIQNKLNIGRYLCLSSRSFINFDMQHGERWPAFSLNRIISPAVSSDYNHVDLKNSMTVALDFYTLFSKTVYIYYMLWSYCIFNTACACK